MRIPKPSAAARAVMRSNEPFDSTSDWRPSTPAVTDGTVDDVLRSHPNLLVHFWADWDRHDVAVDRIIQEVQPRFANRLHFVSYDVNANASFAQRCRVANVPFLAVFVNGREMRPILAINTAEKLAAELEQRLTGD